MFLSVSALPCLVLPCLKSLKTVNLSLPPHLRVPVSSSCVHRDTTITDRGMPRVLANWSDMMVKISRG